MRAMLVIGIIVAMSVHVAYAQECNMQSINLDNVHIKTFNNKIKQSDSTSLTTDRVQKDYINKNFTGDISQTLNKMPGIQSIDIASGFAKPMIRGMAFNRIAVVENGIKQEGQQWGSDHGLEIDAFNVDNVIIHKGPSSLMYGSDAMGGVIEVLNPLPPIEDQIGLQIKLLNKSVNEGISGSVMMDIKKKGLYSKIRYTEQNFGDYKVLTDHIIYLTQSIPIYNKRLKNTAGREKNISFYTEYRDGHYYSNYTISNVYQKVGFFPGAHGLPDANLVKDDGDSRNIELPFSKVNHFKINTEQKYIIGNYVGQLNLGFQNNDRQEWSKFHTHYGSQQPPIVDPDKELAFNLDIYSAILKIKHFVSDEIEYTLGSDLQYQNNSISGYSYLLPKYNRFTIGNFGVLKWQYKPNLAFMGGLRYDYAKVRIYPYIDNYLIEYLQNSGYSQDVIDQYKWRSYDVNRNFGDISSSLGLIWHINNNYLLKLNIGHSFRLPAANELAANGLHHGAFRHEQGTTSLSPEKGWQTDLSFIYESDIMLLSVSPFFNFFSNYIYLKPTGQWSVLPHAGQVYKYTNTKAIIGGAELSFNVDLLHNLSYSLLVEYSDTYNMDESTALSFSPPATMRNIVTYKINKWNIYTELYSIANQNNIARNETPTPGANLINLGVFTTIPIHKTFIDISFSINNLLNKRYYNHLSFYKTIGVPESGRNIKLLINIPLTFKINSHENNEKKFDSYL